MHFFKIFTPIAVTDNNDPPPLPPTHTHTHTHYGKLQTSTLSIPHNWLSQRSYILLARPWRQYMFHRRAKVSNYVQKHKLILWKSSALFLMHIQFVSKWVKHWVKKLRRRGKGDRRASAPPVLQKTEMFHLKTHTKLAFDKCLKAPAPTL